MTAASAGSDPKQPYSIFNPRAYARADTHARVARKLTSVEHRPEDGTDSFPKRRSNTAYASQCLCANMTMISALVSQFLNNIIHSFLVVLRAQPLHSLTVHLSRCSDWRLVSRRTGSVSGAEAELDGHIAHESSRARGGTATANTAWRQQCPVQP